MTAIDGFGPRSQRPACVPPSLGSAGERPFWRLETVAARSRLFAPFLSLLLHSAALAALVVTVGAAGYDGEEPSIDAVEVSLVAPPATTEVALALPVAPEPSPPVETTAPAEAAVPVDVAPAPEPAVEIAALLPPPEPPPPEARPDALDPAAPIEAAPSPAAMAPPVEVAPPAPIAPPPPVKPAKPKAVRPATTPKSPTAAAPATAEPRPPQTAASGGSNRTPATQGTAGRGDGERDALARYLASVRARIVSQRRAPLGADRGRVEVRFTIGPDGSLDGIRAGGAAEEVLEGEALRIVRRASPVSPIPAEVGRTALAMTVTIDFR